MVHWCIFVTFVCAGSAHTVLGGYWSQKLGKTKMLGNQLNYFYPIISAIKYSLSQKSSVCGVAGAIYFVNTDILYFVLLQRTSAQIEAESSNWK